MIEIVQIICTHPDVINRSEVTTYQELSYFTTDVHRIAVSTVMEYRELIPL